MEQPYELKLHPVHVFRNLLLIAVFLGALVPSALKAQCTFSKNTGLPNVAQDLDDAAAPYATHITVSSAALGGLIDVTSPVTITICFWGDMDANDETFNVVIAGQTFGGIGNFGFTSQISNPFCRQFVITAAQAEADLADGDIDITYNNFGGGWPVIPGAGGADGDEFNAQVQSISFNFDIPITLNDPADQCQDDSNIDYNGLPAGGTTPGDNGVYQISPNPAPGTFNTSTGVFNTTAAPWSTYNISYMYTFNGCTFEKTVSVTVFPKPVANLKETLIDCQAAGSSVSLELMFDTGNTAEGIFAINPAAGLMGSDIIVPAAGGCFNVTYTAPNPNNCPNAPYQETEQLLITTDPKPAFSIPQTSPICMVGGNTTITLNKTSTGPNPSYTITRNVAGFTPVTIPGATASYDLPAPPTAGSYVYTITLTEANSMPAVCGSTLPGVGYSPCSSTLTKTITVYNDGIGCGASGINECPPDIALTDPCPITTNNELVFSCKFFSLPGLHIIEAKLDPEDGVIFCDTDETCLDWQGSLPGALGNAITGGPTLSQLGGAATRAICYIITFEICIPLPIVPDICIDPVPLPQFIEDACDQTIGQFIFSALSELLGGNGGGGYIVADTDGDGAFDLVLEDYDGFPDEGTVCVPNNISTAQGTITVRHVTGWPFKPESACGVVTASSINLLDILPIGAIPLIGGPIEDILATAGCGIEFAFSDEKTVEIPVVNNTPPQFANCNTIGYVFSEDLACNTEANWSVPVAYDGCYGGDLSYKGRSSATDATFYTNGTPPPTVIANQSGVYQTAGPIPGSELPPGVYTVTYTAYSCSGVTSTCSFPITVTTGDPVLACPENVVVHTDVDVCQAIVTGLTPLQGIGCSTVINFAVDYPAVPGFIDFNTATPYPAGNAIQHNDVSGTAFPKSLLPTTVTYTMLVDIDGQNGVSNTAPETQTCTFNISVEDHQKPKAICVDQEVRLDNTGHVTVNAVNSTPGVAFVDGGSFDNCDLNPTIEIAKPGEVFGPSVTYTCGATGNNFVNLRVMDADGNSSVCMANIKVNDFFEGIQLQLDAPEICLEANNPSQLDFSNYLNITLPDGTVISHNQVASNNYLGDAVGGFGISAFAPAVGTASIDPGTISTNGVYAPSADGTGFVTVSYVLVLPTTQAPQNGNNALAGCFQIVHETFELRQPLALPPVECECFVGEKRSVNLGTITGGLEPYTIQYSGTILDFNGNFVVDPGDDTDGSYTYDAAHGHNINDFEEFLGYLNVIYTQPTWSFTVVDARGCELFRSGSCDNDDLTEGPTVICPFPDGVVLTTEPYLCESQYEWQHPLPVDNCAVVLYDYRIYNPDGSVDGPHNLNPLLNILPPAPVSDLFDAVYEFQRVNPFGGMSIVYYYAEDAQGNFGTCTFKVTVNDDDPPYFINCPYPAVVQNTESGHCDAYVDFALPLAADNCDIPVVTQIDNTGLTTGDRFPAGTTVLYWEAIDLMGNRDTCQIKVIVNDYWQVPAITCPAPVLQDNDLWKCSAVVNNIAPVISSPCQDNLAVTYSIYADAALTQRKECGVWDASGEVFDVGMSWVKYTVQNQPLLLITEIAQSTAVDQMEITNLGPSALDITCLVATRDATNNLADETLPMVSMLPSLAGTVIPVGGTFVFDFTFDGAQAMPACYNISFHGVVLDQVAVNGFPNCNGFTGTLASGDVIRTCEEDTNSAADWAVAANCAPLTIGMLNPTLDAMPDNGKQTSLQSVQPTKASCNFKVTIKDVEDPFCGKLDATTVYAGAGIPAISAATCNRSTITIPDNGCIIGDIVFNRTGTATPANSIMTLISPYGTKVVITEVPDDSIAILFAEKAAGMWILDVVPTVGTPTITGWSLTVTCIDTFDMADQVIGNDLGQCGANFTWKHPYFVDNCFKGTISVAYTTTDADCKPANGPILGYFPPANRVKGGYEVTQFFCVGTTTVTYTLTDEAGNIEMCSFDVTVEDRENPLLVCPQDITINLGGGECGRVVSYAPATAVDNCEVVSIVSNPPSGSYFGIGDHIVTFTIYDEAGNSAVCTFQVHVIEYVPTNQSLVCNDLSHVSMDATCQFILDADAALEGDDYHCYADYIVTAKNNLNQIVDHIFDASDIGKTFTITVLDPETGNSCWSILKIEDKLAPQLTCPDNITVACTEDTGVANTGNVTVVDCSPTPTRLIDDVYTDFGQCASPRAQIVRTFIVRDLYGNQNTCQQTITITPFNFADLNFPADVTIDCEDLYINPHATESQYTGAPSINGYAIGLGGLCMASINKTDELYDICPGSYEIVRTWRVRNMCLPLGPGNPMVMTQLIKVQDIAGPLFPTIADITISTDPSTCCATAPLPSVIISEGCSDIVNLKAKVTGVDELNGNIITFTVNGQLSDFPNNNYWLPDTLAKFPSTQCLPRGTFLVRYAAEDLCGNISEQTFHLTVEDYVPPVATCTEFTTVAIGLDDPFDCYTSNDACLTGGVTWVPASVFNQGSYDNCNGVDFTIRRMQDTLGTYSSCINGLESLCNGYEYNLATAENDSIKFYCCEVGTTQRVILRVYQTDLYGNWMTYADGSYIYNECMINVEVQDKIKPTCQPPANVTVSCENFEPSLWAYGSPSIFDNCCLDQTPPTSANPGGVNDIPAGTTAVPEVCGATQKTYYNNFLNANFDTICNRGTIIRRFTAWDCQGQSSSCTQRIVVDYTQDYNIAFPADVSVNCVSTPDFGAPVITNDEGCELIGVSYNDVIFTVVPDACYKIERTWTIINWCTFNPDQPCYALPRNPVNPLTDLAPGKNWRVYLANEINDENCVTYKQIIKIKDLTPPTIVCTNVDTCDVSTNDVRYWNDGLNWWDNGTMQHDLCEKETDIAVTATDFCDTLSPSGGIRFRYLLFLDLDGDGIMETVVSSADIATRPIGQVLFNNYQSSNYGTGSNWAFDNNSNLNQRYRFDIEQIAGGARVIWRNASGTKLPELAHGRHKIKWIAEDGCGNEAVCEKTFEIRDCKPPVVACANVNINLMVGGMAQLWATDFFLYGDDNCTPANVLNSKLAVVRADENPGNTYPGGVPQNQSIVVTCDDLGTDVPVQVWLIDAAGNADFCIAYVNVQANVVGCDGTVTAAVAGTLATETLQGVEDASVELAVVAPTGQQGMVSRSSNSSGDFQFNNAVPISGDYTLTPTKDDNPLNGVTTYDLVLISKHILGLEPLSTPYKLIAADANRSGSITTFDIVEFRKLILGIYNELPNNTSWRFVDKSFSFENPSNPFQTAFPENISMQGVPGDQMDEDFVALKVGDVNNTVIANSLQSAEDRSIATLLFDVQDQAVKAGEIFTVNFKGSEKVQGYQFTMNFNSLEVVDVTPGADMKLDNFGVFGDAITTSVDGSANEFAVTFRATQAGQISQMLGVSSRITKAEAYRIPISANGGAAERMDVAFRFGSPAGMTIVGVGFELYQNQPNPFVNKTFIGFHLPEATAATLRVFDETGRMIFTQNGDFAKGYNTIGLDRALLSTTGVLYYTLETATDSATKKMIQSK